MVDRPLVTSMSQCSYVPPTSVMNVAVTLPDASSVQIVSGIAIDAMHGADSGIPQRHDDRVEDVAPRPVGGNGSPAHVITKIDGVTLDMAAAYLGEAL